MFVRFLVSTAVCAVASYPLAAVAAGPEDQQRSGGEAIIVTATRTPTPITAIPNTVRVIDREGLDQQLAVSTSLLDSLSFSIPSLTPGRQTLTSTAESLPIGRAHV